METLRQKQWRFLRGLVLLIGWVQELGYEATGGELLRLLTQAQLNAASGAGIANSLHLAKLAFDLNLFIGGRFITNGEGHTELGRRWKALGPDYCWGGDFKKKDFNHYSIAHGGAK